MLMSGEPDWGKLGQECKLDIPHTENEGVLSKVTHSLTNSALCSSGSVCYFLSLCVAVEAREACYRQALTSAE